nr:hypothetical protein BaRGS_004208 [Batillaria attramentaria]
MNDYVKKALREKEMKHNVNLPVQPDWLFQRPSLTLDFMVGVDGPTDQGIEGKYILARALTERYAPKEFMIDQSLEKSAFEYGLVNHALSAAMRSLIKDYMVLVAQLEHQYRVGQLSLQKMWFYLQPTIRTLEILAAIANSVNRVVQFSACCMRKPPVSLEQVADKILNTGKYLNVVRLCGRDVNCPYASDMVYTLKERRYYDQIEGAYDYASKLLLQLLMKEKELMARIRVDLLPYDLITQLFRILTIDTKQEKDYRVDPTDLHLSGLESFSFDYVVKWPVSLVVNRKALTRYQMLFRHLFYCKHVERQLCSVWVGNKVAKMYSMQKSRWYSAAFALRQRMLNFVQNFEYYMMFEVIEPNWHLFQQNMDTVSNVDDVLVFHTDFLNSCLKDCMLTNPDLLKIVHKLMMVCVTFSNFVQVSHAVSSRP